MTTEVVPQRPTGSAIVQKVPLSPVGTRRVEETLTRMMSVFGLLFALLTVPLLVIGWDVSASALGLAVAFVTYGGIAVASLAALLHQWARGVFLGVGITHLASLLLWPVLITGPWPVQEVPWLLALSGVPCGFVIVAGRGALPLLYALAVAVEITWLRTTPAAGAVPIEAAVRDGVYVLVLAIALHLVVLIIRRAARAVDQAQGAALGKYADAQIDEATESERVRTDALVHDSVLTTFLSAAAAQSPEGEQLAARMAQNALNVLSRATVAAHVGPKVALGDLLGRVRRDAAGVGDRFEFSVLRVRDHYLPEPVADAVVSATVQAMTNSVKHAGGPEIPRSVVVQGTEGGGVRVTIADQGKGFDPAGVASERLGLRVSILERMRRAGGEVDLRTAPGQGTEFVLTWPEAERVTALPAADVEAVPA